MQREAEQQVTIANPYWDEVAPHVAECRYSWERGHYEVGSPLNQNDDGTWKTSLLEVRNDLVSKYSWTIPDPKTLAFVKEFSTGSMVDPMAGTGYWAYVLGQLGVDVVCYDLAPGTNHWHEGFPLHTSVTQMDGVDAVAKHPDRDLLLAWPPYSHRIGYRIISAYQGDRVVFIGEGEGGCTGDEDMYDLLNRDWTVMAEHRPVQWFGVHDLVTVYNRVRRRR